MSARSGLAGVVAGHDAAKDGRQAGSDPGRSPARHRPPTVVRLSPSRVPARSGPVDAGVDRVLASGGRPLDGATRAFMEPRFGRDLAGVRVHTGAEAEVSADALGARAYTIGRHMVFGAGQYRPGTDTGRHLVAHELAHTMQQDAADAPVSGQLAVGATHDPAEHDADRAAGAVMAGRSPGVGGGHAPAIRRAPQPGAPDPAPATAATTDSVSVDGFPTDVATLSDAQKATLAGAVARIQAGLAKNPSGVVSVVGHTDTVGTEAYNMALGKRRADAVKAELVKDGIAAASITTSSVGEGGPQAVATKDEVPNPQNRRAVVEFPSAAPTPAQPPTPQPGGAPLPAQPQKQVGPVQPPPGQGNVPGPPGVFKKLPPEVVKRIQTLNDAIDAVADKAAQDEIVRKVREALPDADTKKAWDDAVKAGTKEAIKAALKSVLQAVTQQPGTVMPQDPTHTPQDLPPQVPGTQVFKLPAVPISDAPKPLPRSSFGYKLGPRDSYGPGEKMTFTLLPPDNFLLLPGAKRLVVINASDEKEVNPDRLAEKQITSKDPQPIEFTAPTKPGKYALRVNVGLGYDYASIQEFEVKDQKAPSQPPPAQAPSAPGAGGPGAGPPK